MLNNIKINSFQEINLEFFVWDNIENGGGTVEESNIKSSVDKKKNLN